MCLNSQGDKGMVEKSLNLLPEQLITSSAKLLWKESSWKGCLTATGTCTCFIVCIAAGPWKLALPVIDATKYYPNLVHIRSSYLIPNNLVRLMDRRLCGKAQDSPFPLPQRHPPIIHKQFRFWWPHRGSRLAAKYSASESLKNSLVDPKSSKGE